MTNDDQQNLKNVTSVSTGGDSVTLDANGRKATDRATDNDDLTNVVNRRVRPYFVGCRMFRLPGW